MFSYLLQRHKPSTGIAIKNAVQFTLNFASQLGNDVEEVDTEDFECNDEENIHSRERLFSEPPCIVETVDETLNIYKDSFETLNIYKDSFSGWPLGEVPKNLTWDNYTRKMSSDLVRKCFIAHL